MNNRHFESLALLCALLGTQITQAAESTISPLKLEKIITGEGATRVDTSLVYSSGTLAINPFATGASVVAPNYGGDLASTNSYALVAAVSYGLSKKTQVSVSGAVNSENTSLNIPPFNERRSGQFSGLNISMTHLAYNDAESKTSIALFGGVDLGRAIKSPTTGSTDRVSGRSGSIGLNLSHVIDPVVLSLTTSYQFNASSTAGSDSVKLPDVFSVSPALYMQINERVGFGAGFSVASYGDYTVNGEKTFNGQTLTALNLQANYQVARDSAVGLSFSFPTSRPGSSSISIRLLRDIY